MTAIDSGRQIDEARRLYDAGDLDAAAAIFATLASDAAGPDQASAAVGLSVTAERMAQILLEENAPAEAADLLLQALAVPGVADAARLRVLLGIAHLEMACAEFEVAVEAGPDADTAALAIELLARTLPLRGRDADAETVWSYGLDHEDADLAAQVEMRRDRT